MDKTLLLVCLVEVYGMFNCSGVFLPLWCVFQHFVILYRSFGKCKWEGRVGGAIVVWCKRLFSQKKIFKKNKK